MAIKRPRRGLTPAQLVEGLFTLRAAGGERRDVPSDGVSAKGPARTAALSDGPHHQEAGRAVADGSAAKHIAMVTNLHDPPDGSGLDLIRWQRARWEQSSTATTC